MASDPAPGELELVRAFVNTWDGEERSEAIGTPDELRAWLTEHRLLEGAPAVSPAEHRRAVGVREALRGLLLANAGVEPAPEAAATVDEAARRAGLGVRFGPDGSPRTEAHADGVDGALGRLLAVVAAAHNDGTWLRLKACPADDCQWAYYDRSRNRSAVWCDMGVCGNRQKVRSFRERTRPHAAGS